MTTLVTGAAGFIGFHVAKRLLADGHRVVGLDNLNSYYDPALKQARLDQLTAHTRFTFERLDVSDRVAMPEMFRRYGPVRVVHLAAQAGVRYSIDNPHAYVDANLVGFINILEGCRHRRWSIWSSRPRVPCTAPTPPCHSRSTTMSTTR